VGVELAIVGAIGEHLEVGEAIGPGNDHQRWTEFADVGAA
jgi:hypothetical protein